MKLLIGFLSLLLIVSIYWNFFSKKEVPIQEKTVTKSNTSEKKDLNFQDKKVSKKVTNGESTTDKNQTLKYKDIFKEPKALQTDIEKIVQRDQVKDLDAAVEDLIKEADALIINKKLTLTPLPISEEKKAEYLNKLKKLETKLGKLETD